MLVADCTTPANFFHLLRRQNHAQHRRPLVGSTHKRLLRHRQVISTMDELANGEFQTISDDAVADPSKVEKLVFCQGKIYYDLLKKKEELNAENVALIRLEQLYPLDKEKIDAILNKYSNKKHIIWAQEEPENMGAWTFLLRKLRDIPF